MVDRQELLKFIEMHHTTTFDSWVDYPSPNYTVIWKGKEYSSGFCGDFQTIIDEIMKDELLKLDYWFPEKCY